MRKRRKVSHDIDVPPYAEDMAKTLCTTFNIENEASRLMEGLTSVLHDHGLDISSSSASPSNGPIPVSQLPLLMVTLTLYLAMAISGTEVRPEQLETQKILGISCVQDMLSTQPTTASSLTTIAEDEMHILVSHFLRQAVTDSWLSMPWFSTLIAVSSSQDDDDDDDISALRAAEKKGKRTPLRRKEKHAPRPTEVADDVKSEMRTINSEEADTRAGLLAGLGTMFQDSLDWLAEDRVVRYIEWEKKIRAQIAEMEGVEPPAVDAAVDIKGKKEERKKPAAAASQVQGAKEGRVRGIVREIEKRSASAASMG